MMPVIHGRMAPPKKSRNQSKTTKRGKLFTNGVGIAEPKHISDTLRQIYSDFFEL